MAGRKRRPSMSTQKELIKYLEEHSDIELPFNEDVWDMAIKYTKDKTRKYKELKTKDFDGSFSVKKIPNGSINPVSKYFQIMALPQYSKPKASKNSLKDDSSPADIFSDDFKGYKVDERKFLTERLADYYDNYEINNGSDKFIVHQIVVYELEMNKLNSRMASGKDVYSQLEKVTKQYLSLCEGLKTLKKQRGALDDEGKNKFTLFLDELEREGDFKYSFDDVQDEIDIMLDTFQKSVYKVYHEG